RARAIPLRPLGGSRRDDHPLRLVAGLPGTPRDRPSAEAGMTDAIDVCVCTYRRSSLVATLESLSKQAQPITASVRILVVDNDHARSAEPMARAAARRLRLDLSYLHCPAANISIARNGALEHATGDWIAFIDDDEVASP